MKQTPHIWVLRCQQLFMALSISLMLFGCDHSAETRQSDTDIVISDAWQNVMTGADRQYFFQLIEAYFHDRDIAIVLDRSNGNLDSTDGKLKVGLINLAQVCAQSEQSEWEQIVTSHFDKLLLSEKAAENIPTDFELARQNLRVRLYPRDFIADLDENSVIFSENLSNTITLVVYDLPETVVTVTDKQAKSWGMPSSELMQIARSNTQKVEIELKRKSLSDKIDILAFTGDDFYTSSHILFIEDYPACLGKYGAIVAIPTRDVAACYPVDNANVTATIDQLMPKIYQIAREGPGTINDNLYWYHDFQFDVLPYAVKSDRFVFVPPDAFVDVINELTHE